MLKSKVKRCATLLTPTHYNQTHVLLQGKCLIEARVFKICLFLTAPYCAPSAEMPYCSDELEL